MRSDNYKRSVRLAFPEDRPQLEDLWVRCFGDTEAFTRYYFDWYFPHNRVRVCEEEGRILGQLHENDYDMTIFGEQARLPYIVGVSTDKSCRHQGIMRSLLMQTLTDAARRKLPFVYLMPADEAIYRPFGFAYIYDQDVVKNQAIRPGNAEAAQIRSGRVSFSGIRAKRPDSYTAFAAAAAIGGSILEEECDIFTQRDVWYLKRLAAENQAEGGEFLLLYMDGQPAGYLSFSMGDTAEILEFAALKPYEKAACAWLREAFSDTDVKILPVPGRAPFGQKEQKPIIMGRIAHLPAFLSMLRPQEEFSVVMEIRDKLLPENDGIWLWESKGGMSTVMRAADRHPQITMEIGQLIQWALGYGRCPQGLSPVKKCRLFINEIV